MANGEAGFDPTRPLSSLNLLPCTMPLLDMMCKARVSKMPAVAACQNDRHEEKRLTIFWEGTVMNHLEALAAEWLNYNHYFVRSGVKVGKRLRGGWDGELDVVAFHPSHQHFLHVECSIDPHNWEQREIRFQKKFGTGLKHARDLFSGMVLPTKLDQVIIHGFASAPDKHRALGGGRLVTSQELTAEIMSGLPPNMWKNAVPEQFSLLRTLQIAKMGGAQLPPPITRLIPVPTSSGSP